MDEKNPTFLPNKTLLTKYIPIAEKVPARTETNRPANKGSEKTVKKGDISQINNGCFPYRRDMYL